MSKNVDVHVYPVPGAWLPGVPAVEQDVTEQEAERLVATGAFTTEEPVTPAEEVES